MKKTFQFILAAGCAIALAGCSGKDADNNTQSNTAPITETTPVTESQNTTEPPSAEPTDTELPTTEPASEKPSATKQPETTKKAQKTAAPAKRKGTAKSPTIKKTQNNSSEISLKQAKSIALSKAGLTEKDGHWEKVKRDIEDGHAVYELEFISGEMEYDFEINAKNGNIIEYQKESVYD